MAQGTNGSGGAGRKTAEQKRRIGARKNAAMMKENIAILESLPEVPPPLRPLGEVGLLYWNDLWAGPAGTIWLSHSDMQAVQTYCEIVDDYTAVRIRALQDLDNWRTMKRSIDLRTQLMTWANLLGMNPMSRSALGVAEVRIAEGVQRMSLQDRSGKSRKKEVG